MDDLAHRYAGLTVAVTGSSGYLAAALLDQLPATVATIIPVSRSSGGSGQGRAPLMADVRTRECWDRLVARADVIFHLAGNTSVYEAGQDPDASARSTVLPITHLAMAARQAKRRPRVVYASTATVYGLTDTLPVGEDVDPKPITIYDRHKLTAEKHLERASQEHVVDGISLRLSNVYGPSPRTPSAADRGILNRVTRLALEGRALCLYGGGHYLRDYVYVGDAVRAFLAVAVQPGLNSGTFNVGSGVGVTIRDAFQVVATEVEKARGTRIDVRDAPWPDEADPIEFRQFTANIDRIGSACGWAPEVALVDGVNHLIADFVGRPQP